MADPWFKFYPTDWRSDSGLRMCSRAARGLWIDMLTIMHEATPRGELRVAGVALDVATLSRCLGEPADDVAADLAELERAGVFSRRKNGVIFSRRMVRDEEKRRKLRENGKKGGNPTLGKQTIKRGLDNQQDKPTDTRSQKPESNTRESASQAPALKAENFDEAWRSWPAGQGRQCGEPNALRSWLSAMRDGHDEAEMAKGVAAYVASKPQFVIKFDKFIRDQVWREWLPKPTPSKQRERWQWKNHVDSFKRCGEWRIEGPPPDKPGCLAPADVLAEYGYAVLTQPKSPDSVAKKEA